MSYILDALNKSQKEQSSIPTINGHHLAGGGRSRAPLYLFVFLVLILANSLTFYLWLNPESPSTNKDLASSGRPDQQRSTPSVETETAGGNQTAAGPQTPEGLNQSSALVPFASLPLPAREIVDSMIFSSHIYSEHPDLRAVSIDGASFHEGQLIRDGLRLEQVTREGVVLNYLNYRFEVDVISEWTL